MRCIEAVVLLFQLILPLVFNSNMRCIEANSYKYLLMCTLPFNSNMRCIEARIPIDDNSHNRKFNNNMLVKNLVVNNTPSLEIS